MGRRPYSERDVASISTELSYNEYHDQVIGFEDLGDGPKEPKVAKAMLVFMVPGDFFDKLKN